MKNYSWNYEIPTYEKIKNRIDSLFVENNKNKNPIRKCKPLAYTPAGFPVEHYQIGSGPLHVVAMAGTHGNEIISVDFLSQLMKSIVKGEGDFASFNGDEFTLDIIPLQNVESFIISTSAAKTKITDTMIEEEIESICHDYWAAFREADMIGRKNPDNHNVEFQYQTMFADATPDSIVADKTQYETEEEFKQRQHCYETLKDNLRKTIAEYTKLAGPLPKGSLIVWQADSLGVNENQNSPINSKNSWEIRKKNKESNDLIYGRNRFANLASHIPGPIGTNFNWSSHDHFAFTNSNAALIALLDSYQKANVLASFITYHGTAGWVYNRPSLEIDESILPIKKRHQIAGINQTLAKIYQQYVEKAKISTQGELGKENLIINDPDAEGLDELLRAIYPGTLLVELSPMGGNPLAPYGDRLGNYQSTILQNKAAFAAMLMRMKEIHQYITDPGSVLLPDYNPETMGDNISFSEEERLRRKKEWLNNLKQMALSNLESSQPNEEPKIHK